MPGDFREFFDLRKLDDRAMDQIRWVLLSPAYEDSFKPYMLGVLHSLNQMWKDRSKERHDKYPDDFLAGSVIFGEGLLKFFDVLLAEADMERIHHAMANMTPDDMYDHKRRAGEVKPVVGLDQSASPQPMPADEDF